MFKPLSLFITITTALTLTACSTTKSKSKDNPNDLKLKKEDFIPSITKPQIRTLFIEDAIEGNKFIEHHRVFILENPSSWSR